MSETHFSCDTFDRELYMWSAILSALLCPEMDWNTHIAEKEGAMCYFK